MSEPAGLIKPRIEDLAGMLQRYAKPDIKEREVEVAWKSFADEWRQKNNLEDGLIIARETLDHEV